jgi:hypothetical protein
MKPIVGFGIDRVAAATEETGERHGGRILRMENLDTDLPLPPETLETTRTTLDDPRPNIASTPGARSWSPPAG